MSEELYPLFGSQWSPNVPTELKQIFNQNSSDTETANSRKQSQTYESLILDEEYEIQSGDIQNSSLAICPICYRYVENSEIQIYSCVLQNYYDIHNFCAKQVKSNHSSLFKFGENDIRRADHVEKISFFPDLLSLDSVKVFVEFQLFHPISGESIIKLNHTTYLQHQKNKLHGIIIQDYALHEQKLYQPKKIFLPLLEGRIQVEVNILDQNLIQEGKSNIKWEFFYNLTQNNEQNDITLQVDELKISLQLQEKTKLEVQKESGYDLELNTTKILTLRYLMIQFEDLIKFIKQKEMTPKMSPDSFLFSPKLTVSPFTPQISPSPIRARFQSFQLEETSNPPQFVPDEWTEEIAGLEQIRGNVLNFVKTQHGSRLIQKYFTTCTQIELDQLLNEIGPHISDLMIDPYANYMFGSLSQSCAPNQRFYIFQTISHRIVDIACDKKGTHAIQSLVSLINSKQEEEIVESSIRNNILQLILDSQGTHLIKKIIARFQEERLASIFNKIIEKFLSVVNHQFGLCVLKDLMTKFKGNTERSFQLLNKMRDSLDDIVQDPYGNYAIQHAIDTFGDHKCVQILDRILQKLVQLSIHKYSSNVIEKCILETSLKTQRKFIKQLSQDNCCLELMKNKFGTFVLQKALTEAEKQNTLRQEYELLYNSLNRNVNQVYTLTIKQKWLDFLQKRQ